MLSFFKLSYLKVLVIALIILFSFVYGVSHFMQYTLGIENLKKRILEKEQLIKGLKLSNDSLSNFISTQKDAMLAKDNLIEFFKLKDGALVYKIENINTQIKNLSSSYEKASHFTANYNSDSIVFYFSKYSRYNYKTSQ